MKKRIFLPVALVSALVLSSCVKEDIAESSASDSEVGTMEFTAGVETKTVLQDDKYVLWTDGDKINVNGYESAALELDEPVQTATFKFTNAIIDAPFKAVFPSSIYKDANTVTLPSYQIYTAGSFSEAAVPMAAQSEETNLNFKHLCAVIKLTVNAADSDDECKHDRISYVEFYGGNDEQVSGDFTIDHANATLTGASSEEADKKVRYKVALPFSSGDGTFEMYVAVPAIEYASGYTFKLIDNQGHYMEAVKKSGVTLSAGKIYDMPPFDFVPTGTELGVEIATAEELIQFATDYNAKKYDFDKQFLLIATLTQDIEFTEETSAAFAATGGIGVRNDETQYYFDGLFRGNDCVIKNYTANIPLFAATNAGAKIENLTIDESCSFTFDPEVLDYMSTVVGWHKGSLINVTVNADVTMNAAELDANKALGGICARIVEGHVENCTYAGDIWVPSGVKFTGCDVSIGGIAGTITNAEGEIKKSEFRGTIKFEGVVEGSKPHSYIGGILGQNAGTVSECEAFNDKRTSFTNAGGNTYSVTIINGSTKDMDSSEGGIVGLNNGAVSRCTNNAVILSNVTNREKAYLKIGGIVGWNNTGDVQGCTNNGTVTMRSLPYIQNVGGIVGQNAGKVNGCVNNDVASIAVTNANVSPYGVQNPKIGGVIGSNSSAEVTNVQNAADITIDRIRNTETGVDVMVGGVIGDNSAAIDGTESKNISNSGNISMNNSNSTSVTDGIFVAGVIGRSTASVSNVINSGNVVYTHAVKTFGLQNLYLSGVVGSMRKNGTISGCLNEGEVKFNATIAPSSSIEYTNNYIGGILAHSTSNVAISDCENTNYVYGGYSDAKSNGKTLYVGGIVGYLKGQSSILSCINSGRVRNASFNNSTNKEGSVYGGGIVGFVEGTSDNLITVTDCSVTTPVGTQAFEQKRGYNGGIAGYAEYAVLTNCTNDRNFDNTAYYVGGIVSWLVNATIKDCKWYGTSISSTQINAAGGIVAKLDAGGVIDGCYSYAESILKDGNPYDITGLIAGQSVSGSIIRNCHYVSDLDVDICSDSNFTGENNSADL